MTRKNYAKDAAKPTGEGFVGNPNSGGTGGERASFKGFVNPKFEEKDIAAFNAWVEDGENFLSAFSEAVGLGWEFKVSRDLKNNCIVCMASTWDTSNQNAGWLLPLRARDADRALAKAVWALTWFYAYQIHNRGNGVRDGELW